MSDLNTSLTPVTSVATSSPVSSAASAPGIDGLKTPIPTQPPSSAGSIQFMATLPRPGLVTQTFMQFRNESKVLDSAKEGFAYRIELDAIETLEGDGDSEEQEGEDEESLQKKRRREKALRARLSWQKARLSLLSSLQKKAASKSPKVSKHRRDLAYLLSKKKP